jgi:hypothetical protein
MKELNTASQKSTQAQAEQQQTFTGEQPVAQNLAAMFAAQTSGVMPLSPHSQVLSGYLETLKPMVDSANRDNFKFTMLELDQQTTLIPVSAVAIVGEYKKQVAVYLMLLAGTAEELPMLAKRNDSINLGQRELLYPQTVGDLTRDPQFQPLVSKALAGLPPTASFVGFSVVPRETAPGDAKAVRDVLVRAMSALQYNLKAALQEAGQYIVSMKGANQAGFQLRSRVELASAPAKTAGGLPVRRDITASVALVNTNTNGGLLAGQSRNMAQLSAFLDLVYVGPRMIETPYQPARATTQHFQARMVVTDLSLNAGVTTPEHMVLALALAAEPIRSRQYINTFHRHGAERSLDVLSAEMAAEGLLPAGTRVGANEPTFDVNRFFAEFVHPEVAVVVHIPETGEDTWLLSLLRDACAGSDTAVKRFTQACDNLTSGKFSEVFQRLGSGPIGKVVPTRVPLGYYTNGHSVKSDIRDFDHMAISAMEGDKDLTQVYRFDECYDPRRASTEERLTVLCQLQKKYLGDVVITDYATEVMLNDRVLLALVTALGEVGAALTPEYTQNETRVVPRANVDVLSGGLSANAFSTGYNAPTFNNGQSFQSRW